ncbi:maestro heat-like repeat-containing protein family member 1 [Mobula birostris]|uniref:maestro heat-like repeat-containing protein family member 1 n=1 Tax=Mobula birostris TaxID=1983395 RepID=UPI003B287615
MSNNYTETFSVALIDAALDKDEQVRQEIAQALRVLGGRHPTLVLLTCHDYLSKRPKLVQLHRIIILNDMEAIVKETIDQLDQLLARKIISLASEEMTRSKEVVPEWQASASRLLVALGCRFINEVMEEVLHKFQPGVLPHPYVVHTLGSLSTANVYGMVPFLTAILGTMLPMLGMAKQDSMKSVFTIALGHFSESILEYLANLDKAPDPTVRKDAFSSEIYTSYDVLFNLWLQTKDPKLRTSVVEAVGQMSHLMPHDKLEEQLPKLIPGILSLYRKHSDHFHITQSLCHVLDSAVEMGSRLLETQIDTLLNTLHPQICAALEYTNHMAVKNHNEALRCFTVLASAYTDRLVAFLLQKLEVHNERVRIGTLTVLKHLINSASTQLEGKKLLVLTAMKLIIQDNNNNKVKRMLAQVISAMAHHDYLELEGGEAMVEFIIQQCALPCSPGTPKPRTYDPEEVTEENLRDMCNNILNLLTTTVKRMQEVLWPFLLEFLIPVQYLQALSPVCHSLAFLGSKALQAHGTELSPSHRGRDLPTPHALLTRLLVVSSFPYRGRGRGVPALRLLQVLAPIIHPQLVEVWNQQVPPLIQHLEENSEESLPQRQWEDKLLLLLSRSLEAVTLGDEAWCCQLSEEMSRHLHQYNSFPQEKGFLYKCAGVVLRQSANADLVRRQLLELLQSVRHIEVLEREGVAVCVGFCATTHLDDTLSKLEDFGKSDIFKKSPSLFNILKNAPTGEMWRALAVDTTLTRAALELLTERLDKHLPYEERKESILRKDVVRVATLQPLAITCALTELLSQPEMREATGLLYPLLFTSTLLRIGSTVGVRLPKDPPNQAKDGRGSAQIRFPRTLNVCSCSVDALRAVMVQSQNEELLRIMKDEEGWEQLKSPDTHHQGVAVLARAMARHSTSHLSSIVERLEPFLNAPYEGQRVTVAAFFGELLNHHVTCDLLLTDVLVSSLLRCLVDPSAQVRRLSIRGLGNATVGAPGKVHRFSTRLLSAMVAGLDEKDDPDDHITLEAMSGLSKVLGQLQETSVQPILINIALRIRPFFEKDEDRVRAAAFTVFGNLSRFGKGESEADFLEQVHSSLVSLLLHLNDGSEEVVKACKFALRLIGPIMGSNNISVMFQKHLLEEAHLHYGEFVNDLSKHLISDFPEKINFYVMGNVSFFKSTRPEIRGNAVMFTGFLLGNMSQAELQSVSLEHVCGAIVMLLQDGEPSVRIKAAEALSLLHEL